MAWTIEFDSAAERELDKLDPQIARRILGHSEQVLAPQALRLRAVCGVANPRRSVGYDCGLRLAAHPDPQRPLTTRVLQSVLEDAALRILVVRIGNRKDVYRQ